MNPRYADADESVANATYPVQIPLPRDELAGAEEEAAGAA